MCRCLQWQAKPQVSQCCSSSALPPLCLLVAQLLRMTKRQVSLYLWSLISYVFSWKRAFPLNLQFQQLPNGMYLIFFPILNLIKKEKKRKEKKICNKLRLVENKVQSVIENFYGEIGLLIHAAQQTDFIIHREKGPTCSYTWNPVYIYFST